MDWKTMLSYISGSVDEELLLRNEYLVADVARWLEKAAQVCRRFNHRRIAGFAAEELQADCCAPDFLDRTSPP